MNQRQEGIIAFKRNGKEQNESILVVFNMTPVPRHQVPIHVYGKTIGRKYSIRMPNPFGVLVT